jgi:hypothetical protein
MSAHQILGNTTWQTTHHLLGMHEEPMCKQIEQHAKWAKGVIDKVNWKAHEKAYTSLKRLSRIGICKLANGLLHTNHEVHKIYGTTNLCPCCGAEDETFAHMLTCGEEAVATNRAAALEKLTKSLAAA